jgi:hypothetical protein
MPPPVGGSSASNNKYVYEFSEGSREMRDLLGGKGANVAEMTRILGAERAIADTLEHHAGIRWRQAIAR